MKMIVEYDIEYQKLMPPLSEDFNSEFENGSPEKIVSLLTRLVDNLIEVYGFQVFDFEREFCINYLVRRIPQYVSRNQYYKDTKPFAYFNVVAKSWLLIHNKLTPIVERRRKYMLVWRRIQKYTGAN